MNIQTRVIEISSEDMDELKIKEAAKIIRDGGIVVFPTESVYGIGAAVFDENAVKRIYEVKGRPADNPMIVHISDMEMLRKVAKDIPEIFNRLAEKLWPGPLTFILRKGKEIPDVVTAGLDTVAVRMPAGRIAKRLIHFAQVPVCAPSANISGRPSSTTFKHAFDDLKGRVDLIIKGSESSTGLESTVLDITGGKPRILRPGAVTRERIEDVLGFSVETRIDEQDMKKPRTPGMKYRHYAPEAEMLIVAGDDVKVREYILERAQELCGEKKIGILSYMPHEGYDRYFHKSLTKTGALTEAAKNLFMILREFDDNGIEYILSETVPEEGLGSAVMNRILKAGGYKIKYL